MLRTDSVIKILPLPLLLGCTGAQAPVRQDKLLAEEVPAEVTVSKSGDFLVDPATKLAWSTRISVELDYSETSSYCGSLGTDWRLPTLGELETLFSKAGESSTVLPAFRKGMPKDGVLFSSEEIPRVDDDKLPWVVNIETGKSVAGHADEGYARCVHGPKSRERKPFALPPEKLLGEAWWEGADACPEGSIARGTPGHLVACRTTEGKTNGRATAWTSSERSDTWYQNDTPHGLAVKWNASGQKISEVTYQDGELHGSSVFWHPNGEKASESNYVLGKLDGSDRKWRADGLPSSALGYRAGQLHGRAVYWHDNGEKSSEATYSNGKLHGKAVQWSHNGLETSSITYRNGELHGLSTYWHPNGEKSSESSFVAGKLHGKSVQWREDGLRSSETSYRDGELHGPSSTWHANGERATLANYAGGKLQGVSTVWQADGLKVSEKSYKGGKLDGTSTKYFANGEVKSESNYEGGLLHGVHQRWNEQGVLLERIHYENARIVDQLHYAGGELRDGQIHTKHSNGVASYIGEFKDGRPRGKHHGYYANGKQRFERNYNAKGIPSGQSLDWHPNGRAKSVSRYVRGALHGERLRYGADGQLQSRQRYKHGIAVEP